MYIYTFLYPCGCIFGLKYVKCVPFYILEEFTHAKSVHIGPSKFSVYFTRKNLLFLFYTITFIKYPHQFIYFTRYFNKIFILLHFFIISLNSLYLYMRALSLFSEQITTLSLSLFSTFSHSFSKTKLRQSTNQAPRPVPFFTSRSTNQAPATQILSSLADPRTKLRRRRSFLHQPIHAPQAPIYLSDPQAPIS